MSGQRPSSARLASTWPRAAPTMPGRAAAGQRRQRGQVASLQVEAQAVGVAVARRVALAFDSQPVATGHQFAAHAAGRRAAAGPVAQLELQRHRHAGHQRFARPATGRCRPWPGPAPAGPCRAARRGRATSSDQLPDRRCGPGTPGRAFAARPPGQRVEVGERAAAAQQPAVGRGAAGVEGQHGARGAGFGTQFAHFDALPVGAAVDATASPRCGLPSMRPSSVLRSSIDNARTAGPDPRRRVG
jgi:hypothetical protein